MFNQYLIKKDIHNFMQIAFEQASLAFGRGEVPVGAVIIDSNSGDIICKTHNNNKSAHNPAGHAELNAIISAGQILQNDMLMGYSMVVTLEPCAMCAAAISWARLDALYFGAYDRKCGAVVSNIGYFEQDSCHHRPYVVGGIMERECAKIMQGFFREKRR